MPVSRIVSELFKLIGLSLLLFLLVITTIGVTSSLIYGSISAAIAAARGEEIAVDSTLKSFGEVEFGTKQHVRFVLRNLSRRPLTIAGGTSTCGCTIIDNLPMIIQPRDTAVLRVSIAAQEKGAFEQSVDLLINSRRTPRMHLSIVGHVASTTPRNHRDDPAGRVQVKSDSEWHES